MKTLVFIIVIIVAYLDPINHLGLRSMLLAVSALFYPIIVVRFLLQLNYNIFNLFFVLYLPLYGILNYMIRGGQFTSFNDTSYLSTSLVIALVFYLSKDNVSLLIKCTRLISLIFASLIIVVAGELLITKGSDIIDFLLANEIGRISFRSYGGIEFPYIYLYASPLLLLPLGVILNRSYSNKITIINIVESLIYITAIFMSGTRSHMLLAVLASFILVIRINRRFLIPILVLSALAVINLGLEAITGMVSLKDGSNSFKSSMIPVYLDMLMNVDVFVFGQGFNAHSWSSDLQKVIQVSQGATKSELTYFEFFRVFGVVNAIFFYSWVFVKLCSRKSWFFLPLMFLLLDAALNPHLFSTYGAVVLGMSLLKREQYGAII